MRPEVTSRQHRIVRAFKSAARRDDGAALLDGWHLLHEAAGAGIDIATIAIAGPPPAAHDSALIDQLKAHTDIVTVSTSVMEALSPVRSPSGVAAIVRVRACTADQLVRPRPSLVVVAIDVQDPGNAGAIVRAAEAGGATGVVFAGESADPWGWKALRASMGSSFRLPVIREPDADAILATLSDARLRLLATVLRDGAPMHESDLRGDVALLLGSEGAGLDEAVVRTASGRISIPMAAAVDSLNVAVAAALLVYEARRQRRA